ncbi:MAG TPA: hypothetical protein VNT01_10265 [Symbiobacteriaceae bacterium]|nr:hypothetical protein [Symbiobacteriaceae bacterium]
MLAVDWLGMALTVGVTALLLPGRFRLLRALLAMLIAEAGRTVVSFLAGGAILSLTAAGAFTRVEAAGAGYPLLQAAGMAAAAVIAVLLSRRVARDVLLYAALAGGAILFLRGWGV